MNKVTHDFGLDVVKNDIDHRSALLLKSVDLSDELGDFLAESIGSVLHQVLGLRKRVLRPVNLVAGLTKAGTKVIQWGRRGDSRGFEAGAARRFLEKRCALNLSKARRGLPVEFKIRTIFGGTGLMKQFEFYFKLVLPFFGLVDCLIRIPR